MADVVTMVLHDLLGFAQARLASLVANGLGSATALATSLRDGASTADLHAKLQALVTDLAAGAAASQAVADGVKAKADDAAGAAARMATQIATAPFTRAAAGSAAAELAAAARDLDAAIAIIAHAVARMDDPDPSRRQPDVETAILGILAPWTAPLRGLAGGAGQGFDALARQVLGLNGATGQLASHASLDRAARELAFTLAAPGERAPVAAFPALTLEAVTVTAFLAYGAAPALGLRVSAILHTGLRGDALLEQMVPASAPRARSAATSVQLDSATGLSLGSGKSPRLMLPVQFDWPGVELRDVGLAVASAPAGTQLELTTTIAGQLGGVISAVVEGGGVVIGLVASPPGGAPPITLALRAPDGAGLSVNAGIVKGGGFLSHHADEYGGALDLRLAAFGITAVGFVGTSPFSLVLVLGVTFFPAIELGLGFTLNGVGGLLALERRVASDALRQAIVDGAADAILFPDDPVAAAPTILAALHAMFPPQPGGFVVGPIAELGWGSQAKFIRAKLGVALSLPDPKIILLGALRVAVPSVELPPDLSIVDLNAGLYGEITGEHLLLVVGLTNSRVAGITISGDVGLLVAWGGSPEVALTVGGFHPHYAPPPALTGMRRIAFDLSPAFFVTLHAEGYLAVTSNTLQFGAAVRLVADIGVASGEAWLGLDALFRWAPHLFFEVDVRAGISIKAFGESFANVDFTGHLEGMTPWKLEGTATVDVWYLPTINFDVGPFRWGRESEEPPPAVSPLQIVADALRPDEAWAPRLPAGADMLVRFAPGDGTRLLVHPLGGVEVHQIKVPLETPIDRVGKNPVAAHRVNLAAPMFGAVAAGAVSHVEALFPPGEFLDLTDDQRLSRPSFEPFPAGARLAGTAGPLAGAASDTVYEWDTIFPKEATLSRRLYAQGFAGLASAVLRSGAVARAARARGNAYAGPASPIELADAGQREIRRSDDLGVVAGVTARATATVAARALDDLARGSAATVGLELVAAGVAP
jgi:uncharacterized protein DUF6603